MQKSFEKISKILALEVQNKFANRAIIGGLEKFLPALLPEMENDNVSDTERAEIENYFKAYSSWSTLEREENTKTLMQKISGQKLGEFPKKQIKSNTEINQYSSVNHEIRKNNSNHRIQSGNQQKPAAQFGLNAPLSVLPNIGPSKMADFKTIGVVTIKDLLYYFPRRYDDYSTLKTINRVEEGDVLTIIATVQSVLCTKLRNKELSRVEVVVSDGTGFLRLCFFRSSKFVQGFASKFPHGKQLVISGKIKTYLGRKQMDDPSFEELEQIHLNTNGIIPVYPLTSGLSQKTIRNTVYDVVKYHSSRIEDFLSATIKSKVILVDLPTALEQIHYPENSEKLLSAQKRLAFDEIFLLQLGVLQQKRSWVSQVSSKFDISDENVDQFLKTLPYELTQAQRKAFSEIRNDLLSGSPMNRLLQGDVGSGKTVVAALAALIIVQNDAQSVIMAPTSILAEQHYRTMVNLLANSSNKELPLQQDEICLLTGDTSNKDRELIKQKLLDGSIKLIVGTHALIEDPIQFKNLQLAVIDEQHRFGVAQRAALRNKGNNPHLLVMSATPIPRSLALTLYGDLELTVMDEMPIGRKPIKTYILSPLERERAYQVIRTAVENGNQAFIVYPLIDQGDNEDVKAAVDDQEYLQNEVFPDLKVGLMHGKMRPEEKESVMKSFRDKEFQILVSTTVIEVGVDIPNATIMMIEGANRFGLAQLHQLRGRVGRGEEQAMCLLLPDTENEAENERLKVMTETNDGFVLAEKDLQQRGPGDFIGFRQSGFADLRMAKITDIRLIEKARSVAQELFETDPDLQMPENAVLVEKVQEFWKSESSDMS